MGKVLAFPSAEADFATLFLKVQDTGFNVRAIAFTVNVKRLDHWLERIDLMDEQHRDLESMTWQLPFGDLVMVRGSSHQLVHESLDDLAIEDWVLTEFTEKYQGSNLVPALRRMIVVQGGLQFQVVLKKGGSILSVALSRDDILEIARSRFRPGNIRTQGD